MDFIPLNTSSFCVRAHILTTMNMKATVCLDVMPCSLVDRYQCLRGNCCHPVWGRSCSQQVPVNQIMWQHITKEQ